jgi:hypothetical protein
LDIWPPLVVLDVEGPPPETASLDEEAIFESLALATGELGSFDREKVESSSLFALSFALEPDAPAFDWAP